MTEATENAIAGLSGSSKEQCMEQLSQMLRARAMDVKQRSSASLFHQNQLAVWLGEQRHLVGEALEFMVAKGWAVRFGAPDAWLIR